VFGTTRIVLLDGTGYAFSTYFENTDHVAAIVEHGDHTVLSDNVVLHTRPRGIARASLGAVVTYYALPAPVFAPPPEPPVESAAIDPVAAAAIDVYLAAHPALGSGRLGKGLYYTDNVGDVVRKTTKGAVVFWRKWTGAVDSIDWLPQAPLDKTPILAALAKAAAAVGEAKTLTEGL
jgi:hypothetical protein